MLPLAAVPVPGTAGQVLDDISEIRLAPSAEVYAACEKRASRSGQLQLVGVADPAGTPPLPGSRAELATIRDLFNPLHTSCAFGAEATRSWLLAEIPGASHVHLACHGFSKLTGQIGGSLLLAGSSQLNADDLAEGRLAGCRIATASACQSGHYSIGDAPDEFTGLPAAFLRAGAACTIVSLWQVYDDATALLMTRFYELLNFHRDDTSEQPVRALREARTWLRHLTTSEADQFLRSHTHLTQFITRRIFPIAGSPELPYNSPRHWAAFVAWGC
jgi:CHAT domain-containing protein